jgi:hypothetical protein
MVKIVKCYPERDWTLEDLRDAIAEILPPNMEVLIAEDGDFFIRRWIVVREKPRGFFKELLHPNPYADSCTGVLTVEDETITIWKKGANGLAEKVKEAIQKVKNGYRAKNLTNPESKRKAG